MAWLTALQQPPEFPIWVFHFLPQYVQRQRKLDCNYQSCRNNATCTMSRYQSPLDHFAAKSHIINNWAANNFFSVCSGLAPYWSLNLVRSCHAPNRLWKYKHNLGAILPPTLLVFANCLSRYIDSLFSARNPSCAFFPASVPIQKVKCNQWLSALPRSRINRKAEEKTEGWRAEGIEGRTADRFSQLLISLD